MNLLLLSTPLLVLDLAVLKGLSERHDLRPFDVNV